MSLVEEIKHALTEMGNAEIAAHSGRFFKTEDGQYGAGDKFHGIRVPVIRQFLKSQPAIRLLDIQALLFDEYHETRLFAALALVRCYEKSKDPKERGQLSRFYLEHAEQMNNWDLVDATAHKILGPELIDGDSSVLFELVVSENLWRRRIAIITTYHFIKRDKYDVTLQLAQHLFDDSEDLIHKAVGWMLREVSNRNYDVGKDFVLKHFKKMPRTMLRYAIEKYPEPMRRNILRGNV